MQGVDLKAQEHLGEHKYRFASGPHEDLESSQDL